MKRRLNKEALDNSVFLYQPSRPILCSTKNEDGTDHAAPFSWINPVSIDPPRLALALMNSPKRQRSLDNIERTGQFVINFPDSALYKKLVRASYWQNFGENKFDRSGFTRRKSRVVEPESIDQCYAHAECKLVRAMPMGDHTFLVADVVSVSYDDSVLSPSGKPADLPEFRPCIHIQNYDFPETQVHMLAELDSSYIIQVLQGDS